MKVLFIPSSTRIVAATRYRICEYLPFLEEKGIIYKIYPISSERTSRLSLKSPEFNMLKKVIYYLELIVERILRTFPILYLASKYDVVFLQRTTFFFGFEKVLKLINKNIIFDFDDAIFISDSRSNNLIDLIKGWAQNKNVSRILKISKYAIVENDYIKSYALKYCKNIEIITGPIDTERNFPKSKNRNRNKVIIGWIGSPSTTPYFRLLYNVLTILSNKYSLIIKLIGASKFELPGVKLVIKDWNFNTEVEELQSLDIGVMPMPDDEWTRGKVSIKLLQYMAVGLPVVCSPVGAHAQIIQDGVNGFLALTDEEWIEKLSALIENPDLRERLGRGGRVTAKEKFSVEVNAPKLLKIIQNTYEV